MPHSILASQYVEPINTSTSLLHPFWICVSGSTPPNKSSSMTELHVGGLYRHPCFFTSAFPSSTVAVAAFNCSDVSVCHAVRLRVQCVRMKQGRRGGRILASERRVSRRSFTAALSRPSRATRSKCLLCCVCAHLHSSAASANPFATMNGLTASLISSITGPS